MLAAMPRCLVRFAARTTARTLVVAALALIAAAAPAYAQLDRGQISGFVKDETGAVTLRFWPRSWEARAYMTEEIFRSVSR